MVAESTVRQGMVKSQTAESLASKSLHGGNEQLYELVHEGDRHTVYLGLTGSSN